MIGRARFTLGSWSTFGQTALLVIAALFLAQFLAFVLTRNIIDQWQTSNVVEPAMRRFADVAQHVAQTPAARREDVVAAARQAGERFWLTREMRKSPSGRQKDLEGDLSEALKKRSVPFSALVVMRHDFGGWRPLPATRPPQPDAFGGQPPRPFGDGPGQARPNPLGPGIEPPPPEHGNDNIRLAAELPDGTWLAARFRVFKPYPMLLNPLFLSQIALFVILLAATLFWAARISRRLFKLRKQPHRLPTRAREG